LNGLAQNLSPISREQSRSGERRGLRSTCRFQRTESGRPNLPSTLFDQTSAWSNNFRRLVSGGPDNRLGHLSSDVDGVIEHLIVWTPSAFVIVGAHLALRRPSCHCVEAAQLTHDPIEGGGEFRYVLSGCHCGPFLVSRAGDEE